MNTYGYVFKICFHHISENIYFPENILSYVFGYVFRLYIEHIFDYIFSYFDNISLILKIYLKTYLNTPAPEHIPLENIPENIFLLIDTRIAYFRLLKTYFPKSENIHRNMCSGMLSDLQICYQKIPPICYRICVQVLCVRHMLSLYVFQRYVFGICYRFMCSSAMFSVYVIVFIAGMLSNMCSN